jgi:hypothetical protein
MVFFLLYLLHPDQSELLAQRQAGALLRPRP